MRFREIRIFADGHDLDEMTAIITGAGVSQFMIEDPDEISRLIENGAGKWDYVDDKLLDKKDMPAAVVMYLDADGDWEKTFNDVERALCNAYKGDIRCEMSETADEDWANSWKQYFKPFSVGEKILIKPSWEDVDNKENRAVLEIDPGSSFGTGQHYTTKLCLEALDAMDIEGKKVLDIGCGSGILSIAAMLLCAESAVAIDIERAAVETARENAGKNGIDSAKYTAICGNVLEDEKLCKKLSEDKADIVVANIVADVICAMAPLFERFAKKSGSIILSGIITERRREVEDTIKSFGWNLDKSAEDSGWTMLVFSRA